MRTPLARHLRHLVGIVAEADSRKVPVEQVQAERISRRQLLGRGVAAGVALAGATAAGAFTWNHLAHAAPAKNGPRIAIIGAGLAGLTCAYRLKQAGYISTVYEATSHLGGRCHTIRDVFDQGQIAEMGGELIDTDHQNVKQLATDLGLKLDDLLAAEGQTLPSNYFGGHFYTDAQATSDIQAIWPQLQSDLNAAPFPTTYNSYTTRGYQLDHMSVRDWINAYVPGGFGSNLGKLLDVAYNIEYGAETTVQSSLNLLYLLAYAKKEHPYIFGSSDERFHIHGGNDQLVTLLAAQLDSGQIQTGAVLSAIKLNSDTTYSLSFSGMPDVVADEVVLALPFSVMRARVDYSQAGFSPLKQTAIRQLGMGTNTKLQLQFNNRIWSAAGFNGETYADTGYQNTWEVSRAQAGTDGILVDYTGGTTGASFTSAHTPQWYAQRFLTQLEPVFPGISAQWNGRVSLAYWTGNPWTLGSYSYWKTGQYTQFSGYEAAQQGTCHFAGEHTSIDAQGYLDGAVETGERAAQEVINDITGQHLALTRRAALTLR